MMGEIRTPPVVAVHVPAWDDFRAPERPAVGKVAGSFRVDDDGDRDPCGKPELTFWYCCPCGCGRIAPLIVGDGFKPSEGPSWKWNGSLDKPTLEPSVWHQGHWHGFLRNGVWESC